MKQEIYEKAQFLREKAKLLLDDGAPHSYGEIVKFIREQAEGTIWDGQIEVNNVWHVLDDLIKADNSLYSKARRGVYQKKPHENTAIPLQSPPFSLHDILDQAVDLLDKLEQYHTATQNSPDPVLGNDVFNTIFEHTFQELDHGVDWLTYWIAEIDDQYQKEEIQNAVNEIAKDMSISM